MRALWHQRATADRGILPKMGSKSTRQFLTEYQKGSMWRSRRALIRAHSQTELGSENIEPTHFRDQAQVNQAVIARLAPRSVFLRNENCREVDGMDIRFALRREIRALPS